MTGPYSNKNQPMTTPSDSRRLVVILPLNHIAYEKIKLIEQTFLNHRMEPVDIDTLDSIVDNLFMHLSRTFLISARDLRITGTLFDCANTTQYNASLQTCVDSLMYDLTSHGLNLDLDEVFQLVQDCELSMINEICTYIPNFDEAYMVITNTNYKSRFNFYIHIETNPQFKGL